MVELLVLNKIQVLFIICQSLACHSSRIYEKHWWNYSPLEKKKQIPRSLGTIDLAQCYKSLLLKDNI